jgi:hypothetical protein
MAFFKTTRERDGLNFSRAPYVSKQAPYGWVIVAHSDDETLYNGQYTKIVGAADYVAAHGGRWIGWRLKRDAKAAMAEAISLGILKEVE